MDDAEALAWAQTNSAAFRARNGEWIAEGKVTMYFPRATGGKDPAHVTVEAYGRTVAEAAGRLRDLLERL